MTALEGYRTSRPFLPIPGCISFRDILHVLQEGGNVVKGETELYDSLKLK